MSRKRLNEDSVGSEDATPTISHSPSEIQVNLTPASSATPNKRRRTDPPTRTADHLADRVQQHLDHVLLESFIPSHPWDLDDLEAYFARLQKIQAEFTYAMFALKEESRSERKPFQTAYNLGILPLQVDHERWKRVDKFYEIHLNRARCAYIRHVWKCSIQDHCGGQQRSIRDLLEYLPAVESLLQVPDDVGVTQAYRLISYLAGYLYVKAPEISLHSDNDEYYLLTDVVLLRVIERRLEANDEHRDHPKWVSEGMSKFSRANTRFQQHGVLGFLQKSISRLKRAQSGGGPYCPKDASHPNPPG